MQELANKENISEVYTPSHYINHLPCEAIEIIEGALAGIENSVSLQQVLISPPEKAKLLHCVGNSLKYLLRAGSKGDLVGDLKKAHNYLNRAVLGEWHEEKKS